MYENVSPSSSKYFSCFSSVMFFLRMVCIVGFYTCIFYEFVIHGLSGLCIMCRVTDESFIFCFLVYIFSHYIYRQMVTDLLLSHSACGNTSLWYKYYLLLVVLVF